MRHHNPPPLGPSILAGTLSFLQSMWDRSQIHPPLGAASLLAHYLVSTPFPARRLTHCPVSDFGTICNDPYPPLVDIVLFRLSLSGFAQCFKTRLLGEGFHTLYKMVVCSPPQPMWDITIHSHSGPSVLAGTLSFLQSMGDRSQIHPLWGPALIGTPPRVYLNSENSEKAGTSSGVWL